MTTENANKIIDDQLNYCRSLLVKKADEYAIEKVDRLEPFKVAAKLQSLTPEQALAGMMCKHTTSVYDLIATDASDLNVWTEKITDHINYLLLLKCLIVERNTEGFDNV